MNLSCLIYRYQIHAYADGTLTPKARRRVAQHLESCPTCYADYARLRDMQRELKHALLTLGQDTSPNFECIWKSIEAELPQPENPHRYYRASYGLVLLAIMLMLMLPFTMAHRTIPAALPSQPAPALLMQHETPGGTEPVTEATATAVRTKESLIQPVLALPAVPQTTTEVPPGEVDGNAE